MMRNLCLLTAFLFHFLCLPVIAFSTPQLAIEVNPNPVQPRGKIKVFLTVTNPGGTDLSNVKLRLQYPDNLALAYTSYMGTGGSANSVTCEGQASTPTYCSSGEVAVWTLGTIPSGGGITVDLSSTVENVADATEIEFNAELMAGTDLVASTSRTVTVESEPFFMLSIDEVLDPIATVGQVEYRISYSNLGTTTSGTELTFPLPAGTSYVSSSDGGFLADNTVTWAIGSLENNTSNERLVTIATNGSPGDLLEVDPVILSGLDSGNSSHQVQVTKAGRLDDNLKPNLALEVNPGPVTPNGILNITLTVTNPSNIDLNNVTLRLRYPEHMNTIYTSYMTTGGDAISVTCEGQASTPTYCSYGEDAVWSLGKLPPGKGITVGMLPKVMNVDDGTLIQFEAELRVDGKQIVMTSRTVAVTSEPNFTLTIDEILEPTVTVGEAEYRIHYSNVGISTSGTLLTFPLPAGTSYVSSTGEGIFSENKVTWDLGSLQGNISGERRVIIATNGTNGDLIHIKPVLLSGTDSGYYVHQVQATKASWLNDGDDEIPRLALEVNPSPVVQNDKLNVSLTVTNPGSSALDDIDLHLRYPQHMATIYTSYMGTGGSANSVVCEGQASTPTYCSSGEIAIWHFNSLAAGEGVTVEMLPAVANVVDGTPIQFEAELRIGGRQKLLTSKTVVVQSEPFFELNIDEATDPVDTTGKIEYTLTYSNIGTIPLGGAQLTFPLPSEVGYIAATDGGERSDGNVIWDLGSLSSGTGGEVKVTAFISGQEGQLLEFDPVVLSGTDSSHYLHQVGATRSTRMQNVDNPLLEMDLSPVVTLPNSTVNVTLTVTNPGTTDLSPVELRLRYPEHLELLYTSSMTTGSSANSVICEGQASTLTYCSSGEVVVWDLGMIPAGEHITVTMPPTITNGTPVGTLIPFDAELRVNGRQLTRLTKSLFVGDYFQYSGNYPPCGDINSNQSVTLQDLIFVLQNISGTQVDFIGGGDCNNDGIIGLPEAVGILQDLQ